MRELQQRVVRHRIQLFGVSQLELGTENACKLSRN